MGMRRLIQISMCLAFFLIGLFAGEAGASPAKSVVLVLIDKVTWSELADVRPMYLSRAARLGAVGIMSNKTASTQVDSASAYLTIGTGQRSIGGPDAGLPVNRARAERIGRANQASPYRAEVGLLARRLRAAGLETTVIGNADVLSAAGAYEYGREVELIGMDRSGRVLAPLSRRAAAGNGSIDQRTVVAELDRAMRQPGLIVIETGDTRRADRPGAIGGDEGQAERKRQAIIAADALIGAVLSRIDTERDLLLIVSPSPPARAGAAERRALTPIIAVGADFRAGTLVSPATRRIGLATNLDVAPTIAAHLGAVWDPVAPGKALRSEGRRSSFSEMAERARAYTMTEEMSLPLIYAYGLIVMAGLAMAAVLFSVSGRSARRLVVPARFALLAAMSFPLGIFLAPILPAGTESIWVHVAYVFGLTVLFTVMLGRLDTNKAVLIAASATVLFVLGNILLGSPGDIDSAFGYTAVTAARFYGIGNHYLALLFAAVVVTSFLWLEDAPRGRPFIVLPAAYGVIVLMVGHGSWGANTGGILMLAPALAIAYARISTGRFAPRYLFYAAVAGVVALGLLAGVDAWLPEDSAHIGTAALQLYTGGAQAFNTLVIRKIQANLETFVFALSLAVPLAIAIAVGALLARGRGVRWSPPAFRHPAVRSALVVGLVGGAWGSVVNDSGVAVAAFVAAFLLPSLLLVELGEIADPSD